MAVTVLDIGKVFTAKRTIHMDTHCISTAPNVNLRQYPGSACRRSWLCWSRPCRCPPSPSRSPVSRLICVVAMLPNHPVKGECGALGWPRHHGEASGEVTGHDGHLQDFIWWGNTTLAILDTSEVLGGGHEQILNVCENCIINTRRFWTLAFGGGSLVGSELTSGPS